MLIFELLHVWKAALGSQSWAAGVWHSEYLAKQLCHTSFSRRTGKVNKLQLDWVSGAVNPQPQRLCLCRSWTVCLAVPSLSYVKSSGLKTNQTSLPLGTSQGGSAWIVALPSGFGRDNIRHWWHKVQLDRDTWLPQTWGQHHNIPAKGGREQIQGKGLWKLPGCARDAGAQWINTNAITAMGFIVCSFAALVPYSLSNPPLHALLPATPDLEQN